VSGAGRYDSAETATTTVPDGLGGTREVAYIVPRVPSAADPVPMAWHRVVGDDRLDLLAVRYLGDPAAAWRVADANQALDPDELTGPDAVGRVVVIPVPGV
jgi:hypothetical protein